MSGPIVRTGTNPKFWSNWDRVFGDKGSSATAAPAKASKKKAAPKAAKKKAAAPKKTAKKVSKKAK